MIGASIIIVSDLNPLKYIVECSPNSARLTRWASSLQKFFVLEVRHEKGITNSNVDALTRLPTVSELEESQCEGIDEVLSLDMTSQTPGWMYRID